MKTNIWIFLLAITLLCSCTEAHRRENSRTIEVRAQTMNERPYSNPALIYGTDIFSLLTALSRAGDDVSVLRFTEKSCVQKYGKEKVIEFYRRTGFEKRLTAIKKVNDSTYLMNYTAKIYATNSLMQIKAVMQNDTAKLCITDEVLSQSLVFK